MLKTLILVALMALTTSFSIPSAKPFGYRNILLVPINVPANGYHRGDTISFRVYTRQSPGGIDAPPLPNFPFWTSIIRPDGQTYGGKWFWRTDANGELTIGCVLINNSAAVPDGPYTFQAFTAQPLPDGTFDGDGYTFYVTG